MKGTKLWQGPGSPLIQGRSRQIRPLWQPWLVAVVLAMAICNAITYLWFLAFPPEFFLVPSMAGAIVGVWLSRTMGWKARWILGTSFAVVLNVIVFIFMQRWFPAAMWHIGKVG